MARIELKRLTKTFPGERGHPVPALEELELTVEPGEFMVLAGPSGSGKTTTLRLVAGLEKATSGQVLFDGELMNGRPAHAREVAMVFQRDALYPHMTVYENLSLGLRLRGDREIDRRVRETAEQLGVSELLGRLPRELSGGQRQRVAVGRAMVRRPAVFLFDEPLSNLEGPLRAQLRREIAALQRRLGVTTLYVTHDQAEAMVLGDRIAVLDGGRLQQVAAPAELYARPARAVVAGMFGSPPMNLLRAVVLPGGEGVELDSSPPGAMAGAARVPLGVPQREGLARWIGGRVIVGVRPEDIQLRAEADFDAASWKGTVEWVEWLGCESVVCVRVGGQALLARARPDPGWEVGARLGVVFDPAAVHGFSAADGQRLF